MLFRIISIGKKTNRKRDRTYRTINEETAIAMVEAEDGVVQQVIKLPNPPATSEQISYAESLGIKLSENADRIEVVFSILCVLAEKHHIARVVYLTDVNGNPWMPMIEPYTFQRSKEGVRLRCWVYGTELLPDSDFKCVLGDQAEGWHLYLIDDIESVRDTGESFTPRKHKQAGDLTITFSVGLDGIVNIDWKK